MIASDKALSEAVPRIHITRNREERSTSQSEMLVEERIEIPSCAWFDDRGSHEKESVERLAAERGCSYVPAWSTQHSTHDS